MEILNYSKVSSNLKGRGLGGENLLKIFALICLVFWISLKVWTVLFNFDYFNHPFFDNSYYDSTYQRVVTHIFLPNVLLTTGAYILLLSKDKLYIIAGISLFLFAILASLNYGSRGLFMLTFLLVFLGVLSRSSISYFIVFLIILTPFVFVFMMGYSGQVFLEKFEGLILRLDVYHVILHTQLFGNFDLSASVNEYSRVSGLITTNDYNTGVGFPIFLSIYEEASYIVSILSGILIGLIYSVINFLYIKNPKFGGILLWSLLYISLHWVEMSGEGFFSIIKDIGVIFCIYMCALLYCRFQSSH